MIGMHLPTSWSKKVLSGVDNWGTSFNTVPAISVTTCRKEKGYLQGNYFTIISSFDCCYYGVFRDHLHEVWKIIIDLHR